ncbi:MAG: hypothetical protein PWP51_1111 [Clostridiales bacterium]|jgi:hypothetical protein|nr:hypothetical protein [Clostridiales bacterium]MDN5298558.1 hypothetical protein [Clostridiales bacterium]
MKISGYAIQQEVQTSLTRSASEKLTVQVEEMLEDPVINLSPIGLAKSENVEDDKSFELSEEDQVKIKLLEHVLSVITGKPFKFRMVVKIPKKRGVSFGPDNVLAASTFATGGKIRKQNVSISFDRSYAEEETFQYRSNGIVRTEDGKEISFDYQLNMSRAFYESNSARLDFTQEVKDPLVINFDGKGIAFNHFDVEMDIDLDGQKDTIKGLASGSGFLALDKNANGRIDDGSELFGPKSGSGFSELSAYDMDHNGWIDEGDYIYKNLKVLQYNEDGSSEMLALSETGVGAIYLGAVDGNYQVKEAWELTGAIKRSSIYLSEDGKAGVIHEVDLKI